MFIHNTRNFIVSFFLVCISFCLNLSAQIDYSDSSDWGKLYVTTWADDRQSAFSFSFDDGFISQYDNVKNILNQFEFTSTHFILPPFLTDSLPGIWRYGTWPMFLEMYFDDYELASHSLNHPDLTQLSVGDTITPNTIHHELYHSKKMINERTQSNECITFAYPFAIHNPLIDSLASLYYESGRGVDIIPNQSSLNGMQWFSLKSYPVEFDLPRSTLDDDLDEFVEFKNWIESSIANGSWAIHQAHEVVPFAELNDLLNQGAYHPIANEWLILLCDWLKDKSNEYKVWIETIGNVSKYIKERDSHSYQIITQTNTQIEIKLTDTLNNEVYSYPLSALISVPEEWNFVLVEQGVDTQVLESFFADSMQLVLANVIPDGGTIQLTEFDPNYVANEVQNNPDYFSLSQNYPNPFNSVTTINFLILKDSYISLNVYDVLGNEIATLVNNVLPADNYSVDFDAADLPSGIYVYTFNAGRNYLSRKMILLK
jgi:hypothetical protein